MIWRKLFIVCTVFVIVFCFVLAVQGEVKEVKEAQRYSFTVTVEYLVLTLQEMADKEKKIKEVFDDAYQIKIDFKQSCPSCNRWWDQIEVR